MDKINSISDISLNDAPQFDFDNDTEGTLNYSTNLQSKISTKSIPTESIRIKMTNGHNELLKMYLDDPNDFDVIITSGLEI